MSDLVAKPLQIVGFGACTPVGRNAWSSAAAARAGLCGFSEHPLCVDTAGEPVRVARAPWLDLGIEGVDRLAALLLPAIDEALNTWDKTGAMRGVRMGLTLALPGHRPGRPAVLGEDMVARIAQRYPTRIREVRVFEAGHAAGLLALEAAADACAVGSVDACIVCGVDSYLTPSCLEWLETCDQLHGGGPLNNAWGFVPGEAAGALVVANADYLTCPGVESFACVTSVGIAHEQSLIKTDDVCIGEGLTRAIRFAVKVLASGELVDNVFCDMNGEPYRADEYGFAILRTGKAFANPTDFFAPADAWGDVGAAGSVLHVALAVIGHRKRYLRGRLSLVWASSESGERGAALVRAADQSQRS